MAVALALLAGCGGSSPTADVTTSTPEVTTSTPKVTTTAPSPATAGEVWQWAHGRNVWTDPSLKPYATGLGKSGDTDVNVRSKGFQLTTDSSGVVVAVTLFNDESALGYPGSSSNFSAYRGALPLGLSWTSTAAHEGWVYGAPNQGGGYGTDITFRFRWHGYLVEVSCYASPSGALEPP